MALVTPINAIGFELSPDFTLYTPGSGLSPGRNVVLPNFAVTAAFLDRRVSNRWRISRVISPSIGAVLLNGESKSRQDQEIELSAGVKKVQLRNGLPDTYIHLKKPSDGKIQAQTELELTATVGPVEDGPLSHGRLRINVPEDPGKQSLMQVTLVEEHGLDKRGISDTLEEAFGRGQEFLEGMFEGQQIPPYAFNSATDNVPITFKERSYDGVISTRDALAS